MAKKLIVKQVKSKIGAKPKHRARMPCGMPLMTTARAVRRSVNMKTHAPFG